MSVEILLLPAVRTGPDDVRAAGFVAAVDRLPDPPRLTLVDLPLQGLTDRSGLDRVIAEHLAPAIAAGRRPWLAGLSLGGWLALLLADRIPRGVAGVALIAPWLGTREVHREILAAGGPADWAAAQVARGSAALRPAPPGSLDEERAAWRFLAAAPMPVWLGFGDADRFADAQRLAATLLPPGQVVVAPGGRHDWPCWVDIWEHFLRWLPR